MVDKKPVKLLNFVKNKISKSQFYCKRSKLNGASEKEAQKFSLLSVHHVYSIFSRISGPLSEWDKFRNKKITAHNTVRLNI